MSNWKEMRKAPTTLLDTTLPIMAAMPREERHFGYRVTREVIDRDQETFLRAYQRAKHGGRKDIAQNIVDAASEHYADALSRLDRTLRPCSACGTLVAAT